MRAVQRNPLADIPDEIVQIAALHAALPTPAKHGVEFASEEAGEIVDADLMGRGHEAGEKPGGRPGRWIEIDFQLDADELAFGKARCHFRGCSDLQEVDHCAALEEGRLDGCPLGFLDSLRAELETPSRQFIGDRAQIRLEGKAGLGLEQREIQVFREPLQPVENPQGTAAVECGVFVKRRAPKTEQCDLLYNLTHGVLIVVG